MEPFRKLNISNSELEGQLFLTFEKYDDGETVICPLTLEKELAALVATSLNSLSTKKMWTFLFKSEQNKNQSGSLFINCTPY